MESGIKDTGIRFDEGIEPREGPVARKIESVTSQLPSDAFLWASVGSMLVSLGLQLTGNRKTQH
ncbi:MAG TPA: hypothetical protein VFA98_08000, partial [Thermoanaerobaculia bacterium]|nr:hypothetical protein [Thermoanaerobaculia bacterium]